MLLEQDSKSRRTQGAREKSWPSVLKISVCYVLSSQLGCPSLGRYVRQHHGDQRGG
jgi:hypothetical protein